ncbi:MAG TPA: FtsX-like permease family protein, partial [Candidatus Hodarchaeales archaeon]|nr:FtsX-like permease family protein [Candidatus Hodarchaeales archaeon]
TAYPLNDPSVEAVAQKIEDFTNTEGEGYKLLTGGALLIATATTIYSKISQTLELMNQFTAFLQIYVNFGLVIGAIGMAVISVRNVAERRREIGMMRAIGFPKAQVVTAALLELVVLGVIGLVIGTFNGVIVNIGFANMQGLSPAIPLQTLAIYLSFIALVSLMAGALPAWAASRIPAAEALRYLG